MNHGMIWNEGAQKTGKKKKKYQKKLQDSVYNTKEMILKMQENERIWVTI